MSLDMEGHSQTSSDSNMKSANGETTMNGVNMTLEEKKKRLKKSIAKMMVYWVAHSRHDLQEDLFSSDQPGIAWEGLALKEAFDNDDEWRKFFATTFKLFREVDVEKGAKRISSRVHGGDGWEDAEGNLLSAEWATELDPMCPGDPTLNVMYRAAAAFVDNNNW